MIAIYIMPSVQEHGRTTFDSNFQVCQPARKDETFRSHIICCDKKRVKYRTTALEMHGSRLDFYRG